MVRQNRLRRNRQNSNRVRSSLARISTGVPVTVRRISKDPPVLPTVITYPVRTRYMIVDSNTTNNTGYQVYLAGTPTGANTIVLYNNNTTGQVGNIAGLTFNDIFVAAAMRIYGVDVTVDPTGANFLTTEYAIQKVVLYGPDNRTYTTSGITLAVDYGSDIPGFTGRDAGGANTRAVVATTPPRLSWNKIVAGTEVQALSINMGSRTFPPTPINSLARFSPTGTLDVTVLVRRSVVVRPNTALAGKNATVFSTSEELPVHPTSTTPRPDR